MKTVGEQWISTVCSDTVAALKESRDEVDEIQAGSDPQRVVIGLVSSGRKTVDPRLQST